MTNPSCEIRPPWPDELQRALRLLPRPHFQTPPLLLIAVTGSPQRVVGCAALEVPQGDEEREPGCGFLTLGVQARYLSGPAADNLLVRIQEKALEKKVRRIAYRAELKEEDGLREVLERNGFRNTVVNEFWQLNANIMFQRLEPIHNKLVNGGRLPQDFESPLLAEEHLPQVRAIVTHHDLLGEQRVEIADPEKPGQLGYANNISAIAMLDGKVAGVLLAQHRGDQAVLDALAMAPGKEAKFNWINTELIYWFVQRCLEVKIEDIIFVADQKKAQATIRMAKRFQGNFHGCLYRYALQLQAS